MYNIKLKGNNNNNNNNNNFRVYAAAWNYKRLPFWKSAHLKEVIINVVFT
jgi:hypothetical protein